MRSYLLVTCQSKVCLNPIIILYGNAGNVKWFFFFGMCRHPLATAKGALRTRHFSHFLKTFPINLSTTFVFIGLSSDSNVYMILSP